MSWTAAFVLCEARRTRQSPTMNNSLSLFDGISTVLSKFLPALRRTQHRNLAWMMTGIHLSEHIHLSKIADHRPGPATLPSKVRQLRRLLANEALDPHTLYRPLRGLLLEAAQAAPRLRLLIDTLELSGNRQILMVALAYRRRALPLRWKVLRRTGVNEAKTHIALLEEVAQEIPSGSEVVLIGDGEFHATALMRWLREHTWTFHLRLHSDTYARLADGTWKQLREMAPQEGQRRYIQQVFLTKAGYGPVNLALCWAAGEDKPWLIATDEPASYATLRRYSRRMWIEELFGDLEGGGFQLHQSRIYAADRLSRLVMILSWVYTWLMHVGAWVIKRGYRRLVDRNDRRDRSLVELGRHWIRRCMTNAETLHMGLKPYFH